MTWPEIIDTRDAYWTRNGGRKMAQAISRRLGGVEVTFLRWQPSAKRGGPESPIFGVPAAAVGRANEVGLDAWQFEAVE